MKSFAAFALIAFASLLGTGPASAQTRPVAASDPLTVYLVCVTAGYGEMTMFGNDKKKRLAGAIVGCRLQRKALYGALLRKSPEGALQIVRRIEAEMLNNL